MKKHIDKASLTIWVLTIITLIISTLSKKNLYSEWWFVTLLFVFAISTLLNIIAKKMWKRPLILTIHIAIITILAGGFLTFTTSQKGDMHLTKDASTNSFSHDGTTTELPFLVKLNRFDIVYYPGTMSHADYVTDMAILDHNGNIMKEYSISMNKILKYKGYRFFNNNFDDDMNGCTLMVTHDPWGIAVTYCGYFLLFLSMILLLIFPKSAHAEYRCRKTNKGVLALLIIMMSSANLTAQEPRTLPRDVAAELGDIYIYYEGRISPFQTFAKDFTIKLYGKPSYKGFTSEQVLSGWLFYPYDWENEEMIKIKKGSVKKLLGTDKKYITMNDFRGNHNEYILENAAAQVRKRTYKGESKSIKAADEKYNLIVSLYSGKLLKIYPCILDDGTVKWLSQNDKIPKSLNDDEWLFVRKSWNYVNELVVKKDFETLSSTLAGIKTFQEKNSVGSSLPSKFRFEAEKTYNACSRYNYIAYASLLFGIVLFVTYCVFTAKGKQMSKAIANTAISINWVIFLFLTFLIILRWIVAGHIPLAKSSETQHFMAWVSLLFAGATVFVRGIKKDHFDNNGDTNTIATGLIVCGLMMMVSVISSANPKITPLMPVLSSPLLGLHVAVIMVAYALLAFMLINGLAAVIVRISNKDSDKEITRMAEVSRRMLYPAVACLSFGIMIGAIWANISWGTYWSWDPKETWSLITVMIYAIGLHKSMAPGLQKPMNFHIFNIMAFMSVLMTYFGVNFILGGMHSYV